MSNEKYLMECINETLEKYKKYNKQLKNICKSSKKITYKNLIDRLLDITEHKLSVKSYKFVSFLEWLCEDLECSQLINSEYYDMSISEIEEKLEINNEIYKNEFEKYKNYKGFNFKNWIEYKNYHTDFYYQHSIDCIFNNLKKEYEYKKEQGLID